MRAERTASERSSREGSRAGSMQAVGANNVTGAAARSAGLAVPRERLDQNLTRASYPVNSR